ncbi:hypothetical protein ATERTT37_001417 [Aspergillus terreus]
MSNLLMFGATGAIGQFIIDAIVAAKDSFGRIAVFTSPNTVATKSEQIEALKKAGVEIITGDIANPDDVKAAFAGIDTVVSALGRGAIAAQIPLIQLAAESPQVKRFIPSEYGTDIEYSPASQHEKPHQQKLKVRAALREVQDKLEYAYVVTGPYGDFPFYIGRSPDPKVGTFDVAAKRAVLLGDGNGRISLTSRPDVGKFVVHTLTHWDVARNRALKLNSFTTTPRKILAEFEKQTNSSWSVEYTPLDELRQLEEEAWEKGNPLATLYTLRRIWTEGGTLYERWDNEDIGAVDTDSLEELVRGPSKALINAAHTQRRAVENVLVALKQADSAVRDEILNSVTIQANGSLHIPNSLASAGDTDRPCSLAQKRVGSSSPAVEKNVDELHDSTSDEEYDPTTFLSRDECGTVGIFGLTSALHARSPTDDAQSSPRIRAEPDRYQLIAEAALQRQKEHDLRVLPTIAGIPAELAMHLLDLHWNRQHHTFLLTYRPAFMRDLLHGGPYCSEFLLNAVFACSSKFSERLDVRADPHRPETAGKHFFERCDQIIAEESLLTHSSIPTIAGLIMLGSTFNAWGQTSKGWLYTGFALRMVHDLGLHLDCKEIAGSSAEDIEVRRRVFWAAFICDKLQSLYLGRPFTIQLRDAHVSRDFMDTFEENELWTPYVDPLNPPTHSPLSFRPTRIHSVSVFQQLCSLSKIMTSIIDRFYMVSATGPRARKHLAQIDRRLTTWYLKLPPALRFEPWADDPTAPSSATVAAPNIIILLTTYNALVILLHRPFIGASQPASDSWERCLTAARNITSLALAYRSAYSLRRANYLLSYAVYVACTIHARNPAIRESTRRKEASSPLTMLPGLDFGIGHDPENLMLHDFNPDVDLLFGFMNGSYLDMNRVV